jgi:hypothetical protein
MVTAASAFELTGAGAPVQATDSAQGNTLMQQSRRGADLRHATSHRLRNGISQVIFCWVFPD